MKILVTGASGYLGSHVRRYFAADDLSRRSGLDICRSEDVEIVRNYDAVIHLGALIDKSSKAIEQIYAVNVGGTINLLRNLRSGQVFIFASTKDVYGKHADRYSEVPEDCSTEFCGQNAYEWSKFIAEKYVQFYAHRAGARAAIFRLSTTYAPPTPGNSGGFVNLFASAVKNNRQLRLKMRGEQRRDLLHVRDLARAFELFIASSIQSEVFNIGGGKQNSTTLIELVRMLGELTGKEPRVELSDEPVAEQAHYVTDLAKISRLLDWRPEIGIREGLKTIIEDQV